MLGGAGVMNGVGGDRFSPETSLTRAMLAQVLYNLYKLTKDENYRFDVSNPLVRFKDVKESDWFYEAVMWAANGEGNTMVGTGGDKFEPNIPVTRAMVATALYRFMTALELESADADQNVLLAFADGDTVPLYSKDAVSAFALSGILKGRPGRIIDAKTNMTRGEVATLIVRAFPNVRYLSLAK
ncbi:MAG: S-layer homology domain-containing protein [Clostridia bacterium]|nr:S-layer homology domain-containing protein [Clostridia bacterium]